MIPECDSTRSGSALRVAGMAEASRVPTLSRMEMHFLSDASMPPPILHLPCARVSVNTRVCDYYVSFSPLSLSVSLSLLYFDTVYIMYNKALIDGLFY